MNQEQPVKKKKVSLFKQNIQKMKEKQGGNQEGFPGAMKLEKGLIQKAQKEQIQEKKEFEELKKNANQKIGISSSEYQQINKENLDFINSLNTDQLETHKQEILKAMSPELIKKFQNKQIYEIFDNSKQQFQNSGTTYSPLEEGGGAEDGAKQINNSDYEKELDEFIQENSKEIKQAFNINPQNALDLIKKMCFNKEGELLIQETRDNKMNQIMKKQKQQQQENNQFQNEIPEFFNFDIVHNLFSQYDSSISQNIAADLIGKILDRFWNIIQRNDQCDLIYEEDGIKVYRLDFIKYLEEQLTLTFRFVDIIRWQKNFTTVCTSIQNFLIYLQLLICKDVEFCENFGILPQIMFEQQKNNAKRIINMIKETAFVEHLKNFILKLEDNDQILEIVPKAIQILKFVIFLEKEAFSKQITQAKIIEIIERKIEKLEKNQDIYTSIYSLKLMINQNKSEEVRSFHKNRILLEYLNQANFKTKSLKKEHLVQYLEILGLKIQKNTQKLDLNDLNDVQNISMYLIECQDLDLNKNTILNIMTNFKDNLELKGGCLKLFNCCLLNFLIIFQSNKDDNYKKIASMIEKIEENEIIIDKNFANSLFHQEFNCNLPFMSTHYFTKIAEYIDMDIIHQLRILCESDSNAFEEIKDKFSGFLECIIGFITRFFQEIKFYKKCLPSKTAKQQVQFIKMFSFYFEELFKLTLKMSENSKNQEFLIKVFVFLKEGQQKDLMQQFLLNIKNSAVLDLKILNFIINKYRFINGEINLETLLEYMKKLENYVNFELILVRSFKIFYDNNMGFLMIEQEGLEKYFRFISQKANPQKLGLIFEKDPEVLGDLIQKYNYNSYGNPVFTNLIFYFVNPSFFSNEIQLKIIDDAIANYAFQFQECIKEPFCLNGDVNTFFIKKNEGNADSNKKRFSLQNVVSIMEENLDNSTFLMKFINFYLNK